jgi:hypothetical protein
MNCKTMDVRFVVICLIGIAGIALFSGCEGMRPMALENKSSPLQPAMRPVGLFTLKTSNTYKPGFQPNVSSIEIISEQGKKEKTYFTVKKPIRQEKDTFNEYLVSVDLPPGKYTIGQVSGLSTAILIRGHFEFSIGAKFEPRSGAVVPLVDQSVTGYGNSTFDISITDQSGKDIPLFEQAYPELKKYMVTLNLMKK